MKRLRILTGLFLLSVRRLLTRARNPAPDFAYRSILVLGYGAIGDTIFFLPFLESLRRRFPQAHITFIANRYPTTTELLPASGFVDEIWMVDAQDASPAYRIGWERRIRAKKFDAAFLSQSTPARFFARALLGIPLRIGHCHLLVAPHQGWSLLRYLLWRARRGIISEEFERRIVLNHKVWMSNERKEHTVSRNLRLLGFFQTQRPVEPVPPAIIPESENARREAMIFLESLKSSQSLVVGLHIGSPQSLYGKIWPAGKWAVVCRALSEVRALHLVLLGGPEEGIQADEFKRQFPHPIIDLVGRCGLLTSLAVIHRCQLFLSNDTGLSKASMALGVPTVTVWGPSDPSWGIYWNPERHLKIFHEMPCAPCVQMGMRREGAGVINFTNCGHRACLSELEPSFVAHAILQRYGSRLESIPSGDVM